MRAKRSDQAKERARRRTERPAIEQQRLAARARLAGADYERLMLAGTERYA